MSSKKAKCLPLIQSLIQAINLLALGLITLVTPSQTYAQGDKLGVPREIAVDESPLSSHDHKLPQVEDVARIGSFGSMGLYYGSLVKDAPAKSTARVRLGGTTLGLAALVADQTLNFARKTEDKRSKPAEQAQVFAGLSAHFSNLAVMTKGVSRGVNAVTAASFAIAAMNQLAKMEFSKNCRSDASASYAVSDAVIQSSINSLSPADYITLSIM